MPDDILELKSQNIYEAALEVASKLEKIPVLYLRTTYKLKELIEILALHAKYPFAWECVAQEKDQSTIILQKKASCCGVCH